jgi:hypothetical protein
MTGDVGQRMTDWDVVANASELSEALESGVKAIEVAGRCACGSPASRPPLGWPRVTRMSTTAIERLGRLAADEGHASPLGRDQLRTVQVSRGRPVVAQIESPW